MINEVSVAKIMHSKDSIKRFHQASLLRMRPERGSLCNLNFSALSVSDQAINLSMPERHAFVMGRALLQEPIMLLEEERLVGMLIQTGNRPSAEHSMPDALHLSDYIKFSQKRLAEEQMDSRHAVVGAPGHIAWNWRIIIEQGISGLLQEVYALIETAEEESAKAFYRSVIIAWNSVIDWNQTYLAALKEQRKTAPLRDLSRIDELIRIVAKVPYQPAETFHEALQSFYLQHLAIMFENPFGGNGPGRMDQILGPYLERDLAAGRITREEARYLIDELFIRFEERLAFCDGWVESIMTGGKNPDGSSCLNELSYIIIESFMELEQTHPAVYPRLSLRDPQAYWDLCVQYVINGGNRWQLYNEESCLAAITASDVPFSDAVNYAAGGCMEVGIQGQSCDLNFAFTCNISKILESFLFSADSNGFIYFDALYSSFIENIRTEFGEFVKAIDITGECMGQYRPTALMSSLLDDCLKRGCDQHAGGAKYYDYGFAPLGITSAADSLWTIRQAVYEQKIISLATLVTALKANYVGFESLRLQLRQLPKYGEGNRLADNFCQQVMSDICAIAHATQTRYGGSLKPMIFNFVWTPEASRELHARADGSFAGAHISHGMTPQSFAMRQGFTTALKSCTSLDFSVVSGGVTTMWDIDHHCAVPELIEPIIRVFFQQGGMIIQGNTTNIKDLESALENPEKYHNLMVRVGGFSAHFCSLNLELQQEIINRHRNLIKKDL